jgi:hypothetical protein
MFCSKQSKGCYYDTNLEVYINREPWAQLIKSVFLLHRYRSCGVNVIFCLGNVNLCPSSAVHCSCWVNMLDSVQMVV